jgi:hypothetical protein
VLRLDRPLIIVSDASSSWIIVIAEKEAARAKAATGSKAL